ncbi:MAG: hypothetical protein WBV82_32305 [Myxococcaceae bacterium]
MSRHIFFGVAVVALVAGCGRSGSELDQYPHLQVDIGSRTDPTTGAVSLELRLSVPRVESSDGSAAAHSCVVLSSDVHATLNGREMKAESLGSFESSVLGGEICDEPTFSLPIPPLGAEPSSFVIEDSSKTITVLVPGLFNRRTLSLVSAGPVHAGDQVQIAWDQPDDELSYLDGRTPIAQCEDGEVVGLEHDGTHDCLDAAWFQNRQVEVTLPASLEPGAASLSWNLQPAMPPYGPLAHVELCDGATLCRAAIPYAPEPLAITLSP